MAPSTVNDSARQIMADIATEAQTNAVKVLNTIAGADTITADMNPELAAYATGMYVVFTPAGTNTGAATLNIDGLGAKAIVKHNNVALIAGDLKAAVPALCMYDGTSFVLLNPLLAHSANADAAEPGFKGIPQNIQSSNYTTVLADANKHIFCDQLKTYTIAANASVAYPIGTTILFVSNGSAGSFTVTIGGTDALYLAGTGATGARTVSSFGIATALKVTSIAWFISGSGLS